MSRPFLFASALMLLLAFAAAPGAGVPLEQGAACAATASGGLEVAAMPPCGYIYPSILPGFSDVKDKTSPQALPAEANLRIVFTWDMENEGTGLPDPLQEITLTHQVANGKIPKWLEVTFDPPQHAFLLNPLDNRYEFNTTVGFKVDPSIPMTEEAGKRLMLLVKSTESGTFKPSFGVEVLDFDLDGTDGATAPPDETQFAPFGAPAAVSVLMAALLVAVAGRRRP